MIFGDYSVKGKITEMVWFMLKVDNNADIANN